MAIYIFGRGFKLCIELILNAHTKLHLREPSFILYIPIVGLWPSLSISHRMGSVPIHKVVSRAPL